MRAESIDLNADVEALLSDAGLPVSDLSSSPNLKLLGLRENGRLVGVVGIEAYGAVGLLRSLTVTEARRKSGNGLALVSDAETWAAEQGVENLYLLTTTSAEYFTRLGYKAVPRSEAPSAIAATAQFVGLCPVSSTFMCKVFAADNLLKPTALTDRG